MIENILPSKYGLRNVSFNKYIPLEKARSFDDRLTFNYVARSKTIHALLVRKEIYLHPDEVLQLMQKRLALGIKGALKEPEFH